MLRRLVIHRYTRGEHRFFLERPAQRKHDMSNVVGLQRNQSQSLVRAVSMTSSVDHTSEPVFRFSVARY